MVAIKDRSEPTRSQRAQAPATPPAQTPTAAPAPADAPPKLNALNPYSFTADGWQAPTEARVARYDRAGPAPDPRADAKPAARTFSPLGARIEQLSSAKTPRVDTALILARMRDHPARASVGAGMDGKPLPGVDPLFRPIPPDARRAAEAAVAAFTATSADGKTSMPLREKILSSKALSDEGKQRVMDALVTARASLDARGGDVSYNDVNWKHLAAEVGQVLDVAVLHGMHRSAAGRDKAEDAVVASIFSDLVKFRETLLDHNVHGAVAAATVLKGAYPEERLAGIVQATLEHQIGPPRFMAMMVKMKLDKAGVDPHVAATVRDKIADPLNPAHVELTKAGYAQVRFDPAEQAALRKAGLDAWYTPHPSTPWFQAASAVIDGDSLVNYVTPEGVGKIVAISGPGTFFKDPTVFDSMFSSGASYVDAVSVMSDAAMGPVAQGVERTKAGIDRVRASLDEKLQSGTLTLPRDAFERIASEENVDLGRVEFRRDLELVHVTVPTKADGSIGFWNAPLDYDGAGPPFEFAKLLRRVVADELRAM